LFRELKLPVLKRTPQTGPSTDAEVLEGLARLHPLPAKVLEYRQYAKLTGTYLDALPRMVHPQTGRVHASFNQVVAATGRLSSSDPNLQNIPIRTETGREIRSAFVPGRPGESLLAADYSQIELRVLAHYAGDAELAAAFARDEDIHTRVASQINGVPLTEVTAAMRRQAKAVNFGVIYGQSPFGLARALGIGKDEAARFIDSYFAGYPGIERFLDRVLAECRERGYARTILGRRRAIRGVRVGAGRRRNLAERTAVNTVIQGSAADIIKLAMIALARRLRRERFPARLLLQIHDELVLEVPSAKLDCLARIVTEEMAGVQTLAVPLKVDVQAGPNWADAEDIEFSP
jgi:DNA polymerase-1